MTYDQLYDDITFYVDQELDNKRKSCLILGAVMEFMLDCLDEGVDPRTLDMTGFVNEKLDELEGKK
jgi:hypothetical protein